MDVGGRAWVREESNLQTTRWCWTGGEDKGAEHRNCPSQPAPKDPRARGRFIRRGVVFSKSRTGEMLSFCLLKRARPKG
jgi:hypothetical protein